VAPPLNKKKKVKYPIKFTPGSDGVGTASDWEIGVTGPQNEVCHAELSLEDGGKVGVIFEPKQPGHHKVSVKFKGNHVPGSVFNINIPAWEGGPPLAAAAGGGGAPASGGGAPAPATAKKEEDIGKTKGPAWAPIPGQSYAKFSFAEIVDDVTGSPLTSLLTQVLVGVTDPDGKNIPCKIYEGTAVIWQPIVPGNYNITAEVGGRVVKGCPWLVPVNANQDDMYKRAQVKFTISAKVKEGSSDKHLNNVPLDQFSSEVTAPDGQKLESRVAGSEEGGGAAQGRYDVIFSPVAPGTYDIVLKWNGNAVVGSPFRVKMGGAAGAALPTTEGMRLQTDG